MIFDRIAVVVAGVVADWMDQFQPSTVEQSDVWTHPTIRTGVHGYRAGVSGPRVVWIELDSGGTFRYWNFPAWNP